MFFYSKKLVIFFQKLNKKELRKELINKLENNNKKFNKNKLHSFKKNLNNIINRTSYKTHLDDILPIG